MQLPWRAKPLRLIRHDATHLQKIAELGRMGWQKVSGYNRRAKVETAIARWKRVIGDGLRSRIDGCRATEVAVAVLTLGRPSYVRID